MQIVGGLTSPLYLLGMACLLTAFALLLVTTISAPIVNHIGILIVTWKGSVGDLDSLIPGSNDEFDSIPNPGGYLTITGDGFNSTMDGVADEYNSTVGGVADGYHSTVGGVVDEYNSTMGGAADDYNSTRADAADDYDSSIIFGVFGYCFWSGGLDWGLYTCSQTGDNEFDGAIHETLDCSSEDHATCKLAALMICHPVACAFTLIALLLFSFGKRMALPQIGLAMAVLAWIMTLAAMVADFVLFGKIKKRFDIYGTSAHATFSTGMWTCLVAMLLLLFGVLILLRVIFQAKKTFNKTWKVWGNPEEMMLG